MPPARDTSKDTHNESERTEKDVPCSDKIDFQSKAVPRDKEGHYMMTKGLIQQEDKIIINIYAPNIRAPKYIKQILTEIKREIDSNTIISREL